MKKLKGPKTVSYALIRRDTESGGEMYNLLDALVAEHHPSLIDARFALAWNTAWQPDVDGRVTLGKCKKASDLDRELAAFDFVIILREEFWKHPRVTDKQRTALLDHELMHAAVSYDERGERKFDVRGRTVYRIRKHDIEEFADIVGRYGCYKRDLEVFASALRRADNEPLLNVAEEFVAATPEGCSVTITHTEDGRPVGEPVHITPDMGRAAKQRIAERRH